MLARAPRLLRSRLAGVLAALAAASAAFVAFSAYGQAGSGVLKVRLGGDQAATRVVLELDRATTSKLVSDGVDGDKRIVVAFPRVDVVGEVEGRGEGLVRGWTLDEAAGGARLRLTLARDAAVTRRFLLPPSEGVSVYRYVVDLKAKGPVAAASKGPAKITTVRVEAPRRAAKPVIVVDAGHGGKDPGASGAGKTSESAVTLAAAKALKARLEQGDRYKVVLTRESDVFVPLQTRVQIARRADADLFISLHADAGEDAGLRGASVYTLSEKGSERVAQKVMRREGGFVNVNLPAADRSVNRILLDLTQRSTRNRSAGFAELLLERIGQRTTLLRRSHRDAGFVVLLAPDVPAVLLEMGFMTNPDDEKLLTDAARRRRLMEAAGDAIDAWFKGEEASGAVHVAAR